MARLAWCALLVFAAACSGSPSSGGPCNSNRDCVSGETCVGGQCVPANTGKMFECSSDDACPSDQVCDLSDHTCQPIGGADSGIAAGNDASTSTGTPGADGGMMPLPDGGTATSTCTADSQCNPPSEICLSGTCRFGCTLDTTLCTTGQVCDTNTGHCVAVPTSCTLDSQCAPPVTVCESTQCVNGCGQPGGIQCVGATSFCNTATGRCEPPPPPPPCNLDTDCNDPLLICVANLCTPRCDAPAGSCPAGQVCNRADGRCLPGQIALGGTCTLDAQCSSNFCLALNAGMSTYTICSEPCAAASNCPLDFACTTVSGMNFCLGESLFGPPPATFDTTAGGFCNMTTNTCQSGWCNTGASVCIETCSKEGDCANFGGNCHTYQYTSGTATAFDNICYNPASGSNAGAACSGNANCRSGVCNRYNGTCARHCCSDANCGATETCLVYDMDATTPVKICTPRSASAGAGALGASCTVAADCESEVCAPVDPADPASPMKCSTTCCANTDCAALPLGGRCRPFNGPIMNTLLGVCIPN